jgi:hypothetical protein
MEILKLLKKAENKKALVFGIGGGGDIVSTVPTANFLKGFGFEVLHGSIVWDRIVVDPKPGPRSLEELQNIEIYNDVIAFASEKTVTAYGVKPTVARAAKYLGNVVAVDITKGVGRLSKGILEFVEDNGVSIIIGLDGGGDAISIGYESGIKSPLADSICVAALSEIKGSIIGVFGFGSDGELRLEELMLNISELLKLKAFLGITAMNEEDYELMSEITKEVVTEASRIPLMAYEGEFGIKKIRTSRTVLITPLSILTLFFDTKGVFEINKAAKIVKEAKNIDEANELLNRAGILTELDYERAVSQSLDR